MFDKNERILSAAFHYFRCVPEYRRDRLLQIKAMGCNTVETYCCWNLHEPQEGVFNFEGRLDIGKFIDTASEIGLNVIVRPGPYICAEYDFGGFPWWLLTYKNLRLRCYDICYLSKCESYLTALFSQIKSRLASNGGPIIAMQVENEYGSYGDDSDYIQALVDIYRKNGIDCPLFTSDGPDMQMLCGGNIQGLVPTVNFGSRAESAFETLREYKKDAELMCTEFWDGWFDHWGEAHHTRDTAEASAELSKILELGGNVNLYMGYGGTNFGFENGANITDVLQPTTTSYDYDSPISEYGGLTEKYFAFRKLFKEFSKNPLPEPVDVPKPQPLTVKPQKCAPLFANLDLISTPRACAAPLTMEECGQSFGYILYTTVIKGSKNGRLQIDCVHDRAQIFINGILCGVIDRLGRNDNITINLQKGESVRLDILVENMGRINFGKHIRDEKGILGNVYIGEQNHFDWESRPLPLDDVQKLFNSDDALISECDSPKFLYSEIEIDNPKDYYLIPRGLKKGVAFVNGFNLGRYWDTTPFEGLYLPAPLLKAGKNTIIFFETE